MILPTFLILVELILNSDDVSCIVIPLAQCIHVNEYVNRGRRDGGSTVVPPMVAAVESREQQIRRSGREQQDADRDPGARRRARRIGGREAGGARKGWNRWCGGKGVVNRILDGD